MDDSQSVWGDPIDWNICDHPTKWDAIKAKLLAQYPDPEPRPESEPVPFAASMSIIALPPLDKSHWETITEAHVPSCVDKPVDDLSQHSPVDTPNIKFCKVCGACLETHMRADLPHTPYIPPT